MNPKLLAGLAFAVMGIVLVIEGYLAISAPSTTLYILIFPIATVGPSFMQYVGGFILIVAGVVMFYLAVRLGVL